MTFVVEESIGRFGYAGRQVVTFRSDRSLDWNLHWTMCLVHSLSPAVKPMERFAKAHRMRMRPVASPNLAVQVGLPWLLVEDGDAHIRLM